MEGLNVKNLAKMLNGDVYNMINQESSDEDTFINNY